MSLASRRGLLIALCLFAPFAYGAGDRLNVKVGLWEITTLSKMSGLPPLPKAALEKMTPEERAHMEQAFKAETAKGPIKDVDRECITAKELETPFASQDMEHCTNTVLKSSATAQEVQILCTGDPKGSGTLRISTPTTELMSGQIDLQVGEGSNSMTLSTQMSGRWLGANCGDEADEEDDDAVDNADDAEDSAAK